MGTHAARRLLQPALVLACIAVAGCNSPSSTAQSSPSNTPSDTARAKLQEAFSRLTTATFTLDGTLQNTSSEQSLSADLALHADIATVSAASGTVTGKAGGQPVDTRTVLVSSTGAASSVYESSDGGKTWTKASGASSSIAYLETPLQYVSSVSAVTDEGSVKVSGTDAEWYHANLAGQSLLSAVSASTSPPTALSFKSGTADIYVDSAGHIIKISGAIHASAGSISFSQKLSCTMSGYGKKLTVTPPPGAS